MTIFQCSKDPAHFCATFEDVDIGKHERITVAHVLALTLTHCPVCKSMFSRWDGLSLVK